MTLQVFRRPSAAIKAANGAPYLTIRHHNETLYIVGFGDDTHTGLFSEIEMTAQVDRERYDPAVNRRTPQKVWDVVGTITLRHFARLGNANHALTKAEAPEWVRKNTEVA